MRTTPRSRALLPTRREALAGSAAVLGSLVAPRCFGFQPAAAAAPAQPSRTTAAAGKAELDFAAIDRRLESAVTDGTFEGVGLLLCTSGQTLYKRAFGADTTETTHLLGSATKLASTTAMMTLADDGLIALDDPISKYLPKFGPVRGAITVRQLFAQTHGMDANHPSIPRPLADNGMTLAASVDLIAQDDKVEYPPGTRHWYRPAVSYHIGGRIAEVVTGQDWATLFQDRVKGPLEMSTFTSGDTPNPRIGGGAQCALQDYGNLLQMHLAGGRFKGRTVLSESAVAEMQKDQLHGVPFTPVESHVAHGYGLSWWFDVVGENGEPDQISVPGVYGGIPWLQRRLRYGGFLLVQKRLPESSAVYRELYPEINAMIARAELSC